MRTYLAYATILICLVTLSACGESPGCRAATGAGIGAAGGAVAGAIGGAPLTGALWVAGSVPRPAASPRPTRSMPGARQFATRIL
jgi:hypothetical protein